MHVLHEQIEVEACALWARQIAPLFSPLTHWCTSACHVVRKKSHMQVKTSIWQLFVNYDSDKVYIVRKESVTAFYICICYFHIVLCFRIWSCQVGWLFQRKFRLADMHTIWGEKHIDHQSYYKKLSSPVVLVQYRNTEKNSMEKYGVVFNLWVFEKHHCMGVAMATVQTTHKN